MVPLGREQAVSTNRHCIWYRLAAICNASFDWGLPTPSLGKGVVDVVGDVSPEYSLDTTSYRLPIETRSRLSLTVFAVLRMFQTDRWTNRRNWSTNKVHRPPNH